MKKILLVTLFLVSSICSFTQPEVKVLTVHPMLGVNIADFTNSPHSDARLGIAAGAEFGYQVAKRLNVSLGFLYSEQGTIDHYNSFIKFK